MPVWPHLPWCRDLLIKRATWEVAWGVMTSWEKTQAEEWRPPPVRTPPCLSSVLQTSLSKRLKDEGHWVRAVLKKPTCWAVSSKSYRQSCVNRLIFLVLLICLPTLWSHLLRAHKKMHEAQTGSVCGISTGFLNVKRAMTNLWREKKHNWLIQKYWLSF